MHAHKREFYIPEGAEKIEDQLSDAIAYVSNNGKLRGIGFAGKAQKPSWHYTFKNSEQLGRHIKEFFEGRRSTIAYKNQIATTRKAEREKRKLKIGDILRTCWGYDQTNVEFFQVTKLIGLHSVELREIGQERVATGYECGQALPKPNAFHGEPIVKRDLNGSVKFASYRWGHLWEGNSAYYSTYA
jgi:hypothetical protein